MSPQKYPPLIWRDFSGRRRSASLRISLLHDPFEAVFEIAFAVTLSE
jgi:hypothetical protein